MSAMPEGANGETFFPEGTHVSDPHLRDLLKFVLSVQTDVTTLRSPDVAQNVTDPPPEEA